MKATLMKLNGKYYGTMINVLLLNGKSLNIKLSEICPLKKFPSEREFELLDVDKNDLTNEDLSDIFSDNHYEDEDTYHIAKYIVDILNSKNENV